MTSLHFHGEDTAKNFPCQKDFSCSHSHPSCLTNGDFHRHKKAPQRHRESQEVRQTVRSSSLWRSALYSRRIPWPCGRQNSDFDWNTGKDDGPRQDPCLGFPVRDFFLAREIIQGSRVETKEGVPLGKQCSIAHREHWQECVKATHSRLHRLCTAWCSEMGAMQNYVMLCDVRSWRASGLTRRTAIDVQTMIGRTLCSSWLTNISWIFFSKTMV